MKNKNIERVGRTHILAWGKIYQRDTFNEKIMESDLSKENKIGIISLSKWMTKKEKTVIIETLSFVKTEAKTV